MLAQIENTYLYIPRFRPVRLVILALVVIAAGCNKPAANQAPVDTSSVGTPVANAASAPSNSTGTTVAPANGAADALNSTPARAAREASAAGTAQSRLPGPAPDNSSSPNADQQGGPIETPQTSPPRPRPTMITYPDWAQTPSGDDVARYYPDRAQRMGVAGHASITCEVLASGKLTGCSVASEDPSDQGFGDAALKLSKLFKMRPLAKDGEPTSGGTVRIPISFVLLKDNG